MSTRRKFINKTALASSGIAILPNLAFQNGSFSEK